MDIHSLPRFYGLPASPKGWREPDERGKTPIMRLRDYVVLGLLNMICCFPINLPLVVGYWICHWKIVDENASREKPLWKKPFEP